MARSRNIKPSIMENEELADLAPVARLLFIFLWMLADREGRLEDRPKRIAGRALPYDREVDVDDMLNQLASAGFVTRYTVGNKAVIQITNFVKHQSPHVRESASELPGIEQGITMVVTKHDLGSDKTSPRSPDSLFLIPDSLLPGSDADASVVGSKLADDQSEVRKKSEDCPHQEIIELYKTNLPTLPEPRIWQGKKVEALRARWRWVLTAKKGNGSRYATDHESAIKFFDRFFAYTAESDFLTGRNGAWTRCDLAWLINAENFIKVLEGKYHDREATA
jgi:hypothetical protein